MAVSSASGAGRPGAADGHVAGTTKLDLGGTNRHCSPQETLAPGRPLFPLFGITRLAHVTGLDRVGVPRWPFIPPHSPWPSLLPGQGPADHPRRGSAAH